MFSLFSRNFGPVDDALGDKDAATECLRRHKLRNDSVIVDLFQGLMKSTMECKTCAHKQACFDVYGSLSVPIPSKASKAGGGSGGGDGGGGGAGRTTLADCLDHFSAQEQLGGDNAWYCSTCKEHREALKQVSVWTPPEVLVIQLKRFRITSKGQRIKIEDEICIPAALDVAPYLAGKCS